MHLTVTLLLQRLQVHWSSVESLLISSLFAMSRDLDHGTMWKTTGLSSVVSTQSARAQAVLVARTLFRALALRPDSIDLLPKDGVALHLVFDFPN